MSEMIERCVARLENRAEQHAGGFDAMPSGEIVRCVIEGMIAPTEAMIEAGFRARDPKMNMGESANATWRAMLNAALDEPSP